MTKYVHLFLMLTLLVPLPSYAEAGSCNSLDGLAWLLGKWIAKSDAKIIREQWHRLGQNTFEGLGEVRSRTRKQKISGESLRLLDMSGDIFYLAKVAENEYPVPFKLSACSSNQAIFEDPNHDFPKRLTYTLKTIDKMTVEVRGDDEKGFQINFKKEKSG